MAYITQLDLTGKIEARLITQALDDNGDGEADAGAWDRVYAGVESAINGALAARYETSESWTPETIEATLKATAAELGWKNKELIHPARIAVSGRAVGPSLYHMMEVLGKERTVARIRRAVEKF